MHHKRKEIINIVCSTTIGDQLRKKGSIELKDNSNYLYINLEMKLT